MLRFVLHPLEAALEFSICFQQGDFRVEAEKSRDVRRDEEKIAGFFFDGGARGIAILARARL